MISSQLASSMKEDRLKRLQNVYDDGTNTFFWYVCMVSGMYYIVEVASRAHTNIQPCSQGLVK